MSAVVVEGIVLADGTLKVASKVPLPAGKVRVTLEAVPYSPETDPFFVAIQAIREGRAKAGYPTRSREEIDAQVREVRDGFDEQVEEAGRLQEKCRQARLETEARKAGEG